MKKSGKYLRNPAPFALTAVNPPKKNAAKKRRAKSRRQNPAAVGAVSGTVTRKVGTKRWHHARGRFLYNPAKKRRRARRKNPLAVQHVLVESPKKNPARRRKRRKISPVSSTTPMSKHRKRRNKRTRNPARKTSRRRSSRRRNPARHRGARRMRNPVAILSDIATKENLVTGLGVLTGVAGTRWLVNTLIQGDPTTGQRMFDLPGVTYSTAAAPLTQAQFSAKNKIALAFYETALPALVGYFMRDKNAAFSRGLMQSAVVNAGIAFLRGTEIGGRAGLGAFLPRQRGIQTYIPGVPSMLTGPSTAFINNGSPVARGRGMGAVVNERWMQQTTNSGPDPFAAT